MCPILDGYRVMTVFYARTRPRVNRSTLVISSLGMVPKACGEMRGGRATRTRFTTERQPVLPSAVAFSKINFKHR
jgi:hypothetical protein